MRPESLANAPEAAVHLRLSSVELPTAHLAIARMYLVENDPEGAAAELRLYLNSGDIAQKANVEFWLKKLSGN